MSLKSGGRLILSVPNNWPDSPIFQNNILNMPPHHQGLWDINSFISLTIFFPLKLKKLEIEPLEDYHQVIFENFLRKNFLNNYPLVSKVLFKALKPIFKSVIDQLAPNIIGHSVLVCFIKK